MNTWQRYKLGSITSKIGSGSTPRGGKETYLENGQISLIRSQNVLDFIFSKEGLVYISDDQAKELKNVTVEKDDILLNITGDSVARVCKVPEEILPARVNQHVAIIRVSKDKLDSDFLKYYLLEPSFKRFMIGLASGGATRNALTKSMIEGFDINIPDLSTQISISSFFSSLDKKIEFTLQMNQTLEEIGETLFKKWFINFNFPGFDGKLINTLPKGWQKTRLGDVLKLAYGKALKADSRVDGIFPVVGSSGIVGYHNEYLVEAPGIVIGRKGTIGEVIWVSENFFPIDTTFYIIDKMGASSLYFHYYLLKQQEFKKIASDSAVPGLNRNLAMSNIVTLPSVEIVEEFNQMVRPIFEKISLNKNEINSLTQVRENLLPKLMTGKLELKK